MTDQEFIDRLADVAATPSIDAIMVKGAYCASGEQRTFNEIYRPWQLQEKRIAFPANFHPDSVSAFVSRSELPRNLDIDVDIDVALNARRASSGLAALPGVFSLSSSAAGDARARVIVEIKLAACAP